MADNYQIYSDQLHQNALDFLSQNTSDLSQLSTEDKTSLVMALNEIFGKQLITDAIGSPLNVNDKWAVMARKIDNIIKDLRGELSNKGIEVKGKMLEELVGLIANIPEDTEEIRAGIIELLAESLGAPTTAEDSVNDICNKIDNMTQDFRDALAYKGVTDDISNEKMGDLIDRVINLKGGGGGSIIPSYFNEVWYKSTPIPTKRQEIMGVAIGNNIYCIDGDDSGDVNVTECYNVITNEWTTLTPRPDYKSHAAADAVGNNIYCIGSYTKNENSCYDTLTDSWTEKTGMITPRGKLAVCTAEGKIYAIAGTDASSSRTQTECYDPATDAWSSKAKYPTSRYNFDACYLNGIIYTAGGRISTDGNYYSTLYVYDIANDTWTQKTNMNEKRSSHSLNVLNGKIHAIGGFISSGRLNTHECYDPDNDVWEYRRSIDYGPRSGHCGVVVQNKIYIISGMRTIDGVARRVNDVEVYALNEAEGNANTITLPKVFKNKWITIENLATPNSENGYAPVGEFIDDVLYVFSNQYYDEHKYDLNLDTWTAIKDYPYNGEGVTCCKSNNKIYLGPARDTNSYSSYYLEFCIYDHLTNTYSIESTYPKSLYHTAMTPYGDKIYCAGGLGMPQSGAITHDYTYVFDTILKTWTQLTSSPIKHSVYAQGIINDEIHYVSSSNHISYNITNDSWKTYSDYPEARSGVMGRVVNNTFYCFGGNTVATSYMWNSSDDTWIQIRNLPEARYAGGSCVYKNDNIVLIGSNIGNPSTIIMANFSK